ncbi:MAG: hypothetical protein WD875_14560 [Pirellulales bacterium]
MVHEPNTSKHADVYGALHRSDIAGAIAWTFVGASVIAFIMSPGGDPYSTVLYTVVLFPLAIANYWIGFRHGRRSGLKSKSDDKKAPERDDIAMNAETVSGNG